MKNTDMEIVYGKNAIREVLSSGREVFKVFAVDDLREFIDDARKRRIECVTMNSKKFGQVVRDKYGVSGNHQGILALVAPYEYVPLQQLLNQVASKEEPGFIVILDGLEDVHNLGAILRTADAAGVHGIIIPKHRSVGLNTTVARLSTGAIEYVPVAQVTNLVRAIEDLKKSGFWVVGTDASEAQDYREVDYKGSTALVIGSEGQGMGRLVRDTCDFKVYLPMKGRISSLNASVAAALLMYEVCNQRYPILQ